VGDERVVDGAEFHGPTLAHCRGPSNSIRGLCASVRV
jgi:hypothetical protein